VGLHATLARTLPPTRRQWRGWQDRERALRGVTYERLRVELADRRTPRARADGLLAALWRLARHDRDAGRVLLASLLPGARSIAAGYRRSLGYDEALTVAVAALWDRIARFDPPARNVAFRLVWLAGRRVNDTATARRAHAARHRLLTSPDTTPSGPAGLPVRVLLGQAVNAGVVTREGAWLTWATRCAGITLAEAAELLGIGYEAAKKRRQRTEAALAGWLGVDRKASA